MPNTYKRSDRVGELIFETVSELVREIRDFSGLVSVMKVKLTDDLLSARIFYSVLGSQADKDNAKKVLMENAKDIRHQLAQKLNLRRTPTIFFEYDNMNEEADKVFDLLDKIKHEK